MKTNGIGPLELEGGKMDEQSGTVTATRGKRGSMAVKKYIMPNGELSSSARPEATGVRFIFGNGKEMVVSPSDLPESVVHCAILHGIAQKLGDTYAGAENVQEARESFDSMLERLLSGEWVAERKASGPSTTLLVEAISRVLSKNGRPVNVENIREKVQGKEARDAALRNPVFAAEYENIKVERAAARAKEANEKASGVTLDLDAFAS